MPRAKRAIAASEPHASRQGDTRVVDSAPAIEQPSANQSAPKTEPSPPIDASSEARADDAIADHVDAHAPTHQATPSDAHCDDSDESVDIALKSKGAVVLALGHDASMHANQQLPGQDWRVRLPSRECVALITQKESTGGSIYAYNWVTAAFCILSTS